MEYIYKYRPIDKYTIELLVNNELYFSFPWEFNDPFDSKTDIVWEGGVEDWKKWLKESRRPQHEKDEIWKRLQELNFKVRKGFLYEDRRFLICSFSEVNNGILMWSHYADSHKGICLGFSVDTIGDIPGLYFDDNDMFQNPSAPKGFRVLHEIVYSPDDHMPRQVNRLKDSIHGLNIFLRTKHQNWIYEKERRIILPEPSGTPKRKFKFVEHKLSQIIFGMNTNSEDIKTVKRIVDEVYISKEVNLDFFKAEHIRGKYAVEIKSLNETM